MRRELPLTLLGRVFYPEDIRALATAYPNKLWWYIPCTAVYQHGVLEGTASGACRDAQGDWPYTDPALDATQEVLIAMPTLTPTPTPEPTATPAPAGETPQVWLPVTVENRYAWSYWWSEEPLSVAVGESKTNFISQRSWSSQENSVLSASWSSSDPSVATVEAETPSTFWCSVTGVSAGSATITGVFTINSWTNVGMRPMTATASFQVTVS